MTRKIDKKVIAFFVTVVACLTVIFLFVLYQRNDASIKTGSSNAVLLKGRVIEGQSTSDKSSELKTDSKLVYQTENIPTNLPAATAIYTSWSQTGGGDESLKAEARVYDGKNWSIWYDTTTDIHERPDNAPESRGSFIVAPDIDAIQYRISITVKDDEPLATLDLLSSKMEIIDASKSAGNPLTDAVRGVASLLGFDNARARSVSPTIISRAQWGSPEPDSSEWAPEYARLNRTIIHHTAVVPGTDSAAAVRSIWQYHAKSLGWGDIGYNYLVDQAGRIYQGRYYDQTYAEQNNVDVVAGHAYGNNVGTTGIAALGNFEGVMAPSADLVHSLGEVAAFKMGPYGLNPAGGETYGGNLVGHKDVLQTSCPGKNLYSNLPTVRSVASALYSKYYVPDYSWQYINQYSYKDAAHIQPIDLNSERVVAGQKIYLSVHARNTGTQKWVKGDTATPLRLGTTSPRDRLSSFCSSWISCSRPAEVAEPVVYPGQIGSFNFETTIPESTGLEDEVRKEYFSPLAEGKVWMNDPGLYWKFISKRPYEWQYVDQKAYLDQSHTQVINLSTTTIQPGQKVYLVVNAKNTGGTTWSSAGNNPIRLGTSKERDRLSSFCTNAWISCSRSAAISSTVLPGENGTFEYEIIAPVNQTGSIKEYKEYFSPLAEGKVWMNDPGLYWVIRVSST